MKTTALILLSLLVSSPAVSTPLTPKQKMEMLKENCHDEPAISRLDKALTRVAKAYPNRSRAEILVQLSTLPHGASSAQIAEHLKISNAAGDRLAMALEPQADVIRVVEPNYKFYNYKKIDPCRDLFLRELQSELRRLKNYNHGEMMTREEFFSDSKLRESLKKLLDANQASELPRFKPAVPETSTAPEASGVE